MKKKITIFLLIDFVLALLFVLMFNKFAINLRFHKVAGLLILVGSVIHFLLHPKYIINTTKKMCNKSPDGVGLSGRVRFKYFINLLLIILVIAMLVNSIMISKMIFAFEGNHFLNNIHKTLAAVMLLVVAIHIGLHYKMIALKLKLPKLVASIIISIVLIFGAYSLVTSSYKNYLVAVFVSAQEEGDIGQGLGKEAGEHESEEANHRKGLSAIVWTDAGLTLITYGSILYLLCFATHLIDEGTKKHQSE